MQAKKIHHIFFFGDFKGLNYIVQGLLTFIVKVIWLKWDSLWHYTEKKSTQVTMRIVSKHLYNDKQKSNANML